MKVLQINCVYGYGSTGKLTKAIHEGLPKRGFESVVLYGRRQREQIDGVYKTCTEVEAKAWNGLSRITGRKYGAAPIGTAQILRHIRQEKPDVVHLQCINGFFVNIYKLLTYLKEHEIPTIVTLHAEFMFTGGCSHAYECEGWAFFQGCSAKVCQQRYSELRSWMGNQSAYMWQQMKQAFADFNDNLQIVSVSPWLQARAERSVILKGLKHCVVLNGVDTSVFYYRDGNELRQRYQCQDKKVVLHVTPSFSMEKEHGKGGYYILELARRMPETTFLVVGPYEKEIRVPENVTLAGQITDQTELADYYAMADVTVLTSRRETFSMVCAESLCCGTQVAGFEAGGPETIGIPEFCSFVPQGDLDRLQGQLIEKMKGYEKEVVAKKAQQVYAVDTMVDAYASLYEQMGR